MFALSDSPLELDALRQGVRNIEAGGYAAFEGWVRNHNEGKEVRSLEYEAYPAVAIKEGNRILAEAKEKFGILGAACTHRTGHLCLEDIAVWVGVASAHRGEAFAACRYIIDEVKHRVPIWKKEHYIDGDSGWVNCERCAAPGHHHHHHEPTHAIAPDAYYARQMNLPEVGEEGQQKIANARVLVVGAGGLGAAALPALAAAGVGEIGICDSDAVETSNLHRQTIYTLEDIGEPKAARAAEYLRARNPFVQIHPHVERATPENIEVRLANYDLVLDCTDNFETKYLLNDAALACKKILIQASIYQYEGQLFVVNPHERTPCLRCVWPEMPEPGCVGSCAEAGVLGAVPTVFGAMQAMEALKIILGLPRQSDGAMIFFDLLNLRTRRVAIPKASEDCLCQSGNQTLVWEDLADLDRTWDFVNRESVVVVDIREAEERRFTPLDYKNVHIPAGEFSLDVPPIPRERAVLLCCARGMRSRYLAMALRKAGYPRVYSLKQGIDALHRSATR